MTAAELKEIALIMREIGITHLKDGALEITLAPGPKPPPGPADDSKIVEKVEELTSLLKLDDKGIMDRMFPVNGGPDDTAPTA